MIFHGTIQKINQSKPHQKYLLPVPEEHKIVLCLEPLYSYNTPMPFKQYFHPRKIIRLPGYDYTKPGYYFITTVVHNRQCILGEVVDNSVHLSIPGEITLKSWFDLGNYYSKTRLDAQCVMPNHFHGLIQLLEGNEAQLPHIVGSFKKYSAKRINIHLQSPGIPFWQRGFYEHFIRNAAELERVRKYISNNPADWETDKE